jgi:hypothetical protein
VIPPGWHPVHRSADGEHVGYLVPDGSKDRVVPTTLVGSVLGPAQDPATATALLEGRGLAALDRRWWCRLPEVLPAGVMDASSPEPDWSRQPVVLVEVSSTAVTVRPEFVGPGETGRASLPVPAGDLLVPDPTW